MSPLSFTFFSCFLFIFSCISTFSSEENFLLLNGESGEIILEIGPHVDERVTPCSTFKIALSLMGFDSGILKNKNHPVWLFQEEYDHFLDSWKNPQTPQSWMETSCVWFSKVLTTHLGLDKFQFYLTILNYGNQDASGGLTNAWLNSSLKISPREQTAFILKILQEKHPISSYAVRMTKQLLFLSHLTNEWKLFGKTGWSGPNDKLHNKELGWFVGWIEKENCFFPFAYNIQDNKINLSQRIPRVKHLLIETNIINQY